jgi:hypothetical protein
MALRLVDSLVEDDLFGSSLLKRVETGDSATAELGQLEQQLSELTDFLHSLKSHARERTLRYQKEIASFQERIEQEKARYAETLAAEVSQQQREIQELLATQQEELDRLVVQQREVRGVSEDWVKMTSSLTSLADHLDASELQIQLTRAQSEQEELSALQATRFQEDEFRQSRDARVREVQLDLKRDELAELEASQRQQRRHQSHLIAECLQAQEMLAQIHGNLVKRLSEESQKREKSFASHLAMVRGQLEKEQQRHESEIKSSKSLLGELALVRKALSKRCTQQLQAATEDIKQMDRMTKQQNELEDNDPATVSSIIKTEEIERENGILAQKVTALEAELGEIQGQAAMLRQTIQKERSPKWQLPPFDSPLQSTFRYSIH